jgi:hypothetical protein
MQAVSTAVDAPMGLPDLNNFGTEFMPYTQTSQASDNIIGASATMSDFNDMSFEDMLMDLDTSPNCGYAPAEIGQTISENLNAGKGEYSDNFINTGFDAITWNLDNDN